MRRRLYFILPSVDSAREIANDLLLARVDDRHMYFLARRGTDLGELHEASHFQKSDVVHGAELGLAIGGGCGLLAGILAVIMPPTQMPLQLVTVVLLALLGAALGAWISSLIGASVPNSRLRDFAQEIEDGKILLMVDTTLGRIDQVRELVLTRHPEAEARGMEPTVPAFP
jgi:uncharacterized membrane protein YeaQ/YmgE (transglycosylase-associated protein family)